MSVQEVVIEGTLKPDGTLELDRKPNLPPGQVTVVLRQEAEVVLPKDDPFWQRMQAMWDAQKAAGHVPRSAEAVEAERRQVRDEWEERTRATERLQEEARRLREEDKSHSCGAGENTSLYTRRLVAMLTALLALAGVSFWCEFRWRLPDSLADFLFFASIGLAVLAGVLRFVRWL